MSIYKHFEDVTCQGHIQNLFQGGGTNFHHFFKHIFFSEDLILSNISAKNDFIGLKDTWQSWAFLAKQPVSRKFWWGVMQLWIRLNVN